MNSVTVKLSEPIAWGKDEVVEELVLKPTSRAFREFSLPMSGDGKLDYQPYSCAKVGVRMAGKPDAFVDKLSVSDMLEVAQVVIGFFGGSTAKTGSEPSP